MTIHQDLYRNLLEKLNRLLQDTADIYEIAGLEREVTVDIFHALIGAITFATVEMELPIDMLLDAIRRSADRTERRKAKRAP